MVELIDFDDLPEDDTNKGYRNVTLTIKTTEDIREMFTRICKRERRTVTQLGNMVIEDYIKAYTEKYKNGA